MAIYVHTRIGLQTDFVILMGVENNFKEKRSTQSYSEKQNRSSCNLTSQPGFFWYLETFKKLFGSR